VRYCFSKEEALRDRCNHLLGEQPRNLTKDIDYMKALLIPGSDPIQMKRLIPRSTGEDHADLPVT
jgi:hypothetical protein